MLTYFTGLKYRWFFIFLIELDQWPSWGLSVIIIFLLKFNIRPLLWKEDCDSELEGLWVWEETE